MKIEGLTPHCHSEWGPHNPVVQGWRLEHYNRLSFFFRSYQVEKLPAVYILASRQNGTLYIGVTSNLVKRVWEHKNNLVAGFTKRHRVHMLVYYERFDTMLDAIAYEKQIKGWQRSWKLELIEAKNPDWQDLWEDILPGAEH